MGKKLFFYSVLVFIVCFSTEWLFRAYETTSNYLYDRNNSKFGLIYEEMKKRDSDIGYFFVSESLKINFKRSEFDVEMEFIDLGVDSLRFRDDGIDGERNKILLAVGDSFVWGWGVQADELISEQIESLDSNIDVINAGMAGHHPQQYTRMIKRFIKSDVKIDGVLFNFFSGNDVTLEFAFREWSRFIQTCPDLADPVYMKISMISQNWMENELTRRREISEKSPVLGIMNQFCSDWIVCSRYLKGFYQKVFNKLGIGRKPVRNRRDASRKTPIFPSNVSVTTAEGEVLKLDANYLNEISGEAMVFSRKHAKADFLQNFPVMLESVFEGIEACRSNNIEFYFVYLPTKAEVYMEELTAKFDEPRKTEIVAKLNYLHDTMMSKMDSLSVKVIDLTIPLKEAKDRGELMYYKIDPHFTSEGHRLWAEQVVDYLSQEETQANIIENR